MEFEMTKSRLYQNQYQEVRESIKKNIFTIKELLTESKQLTEIIKTIADPKLKATLEERVAAIYGTIDRLVDQTVELLNKYESFADTMSDALSYS